jgi:hypothetical protein
MVRPQERWEPLEEEFLPAGLQRVMARHAIGGTSLVEHEFLDKRLDAWSDLCCARPRADHSNPLASQVIIISPLGRVPHRPLERFCSRDGGILGCPELSTGVDYHVCEPGASLSSAIVFENDGVLQSLLRPGGRNHRRVEHGTLT